MSSMLGKYKIQVDTSILDNGDSIAAYLTTAAGDLLTSTTIGSKKHLDVKGPSEKAQGSAYQAGDFVSLSGAVDQSGNFQPLEVDASGNLLVAGTLTVDFSFDYAEDSPHVSGDVGAFTLAVRRDARTSGTSADGDYASFNVNSSGELYVRDVDANASLASILADTVNIDTATAAIDATLTALSKAEDAAHASGDRGIQALAVRKDAQGSNAADGDYTSFQTWSEGSLKVVDISNGAMLQQRVAVANTATQLPASALANRRSLMIQNAGASSMWVGSSSVTAAGATTGIEVPKGGFIELEVGPAVAVYAISAGMVNANILEMA